MDGTRSVYQIVLLLFAIIQLLIFGGHCNYYSNFFSSFFRGRKNSQKENGTSLIAPRIPKPSTLCGNSKQSNPD